METHDTNEDRDNEKNNNKEQRTMEQHENGFNGTEPNVMNSAPFNGRGGRTRFHFFAFISPFSGVREKEMVAMKPEGETFSKEIRPGTQFPWLPVVPSQKWKQKPGQKPAVAQLFELSQSFFLGKNSTRLLARWSGLGRWATR